VELTFRSEGITIGGYKIQNRFKFFSPRQRFFHSFIVASALLLTPLVRPAVAQNGAATASERDLTYLYLAMSNLYQSGTASFMVPPTTLMNQT
jgi:hypothetical protein